jgi:hypothetical protein
MVDTASIQIAGSSLLALLLFAIFGYEYQFPLVLNIIIVPFIVGTGYLVALGLHFGLGFDMLVAMGIEFALLLLSIIGFHLVTSS